MTVPINDKKSVEQLALLSEIFMETMKELSATRQAISPALIRKALSTKPEVAKLLSPPAPIAAPPRQAQDPPGEQDEELKARVTTLDLQRSRLGAQIETLEEQSTKIREFNKRSLIALIALLRTPDNRGLSVSLDRFRQMLLEGSDLEQLERSLQEIKDIVLKEEDAPKAGRSGSGIWSMFRKSMTAEVKADPFSDVEFERMKEAYLGIFAEFHSDLGKEYLDRFSRIQSAIRATRDIHQLVSHTDEITSLIQTYTRLINEERTQVLSFFTEIGSNLAEMETQFMSSLNRSSVAQEANSSFNQALEVHLQDIDHSAQFSKSLGEFKGLVLSRLTTIKSALEKKRQEDDLRTEEATREVESLRRNLSTLKAEVSQAHEKAKVLEVETLMDPLTGIHNRRAYKRRITEEFQRFRRYQQIFSLLFFDLDHFKTVNDQYGHPAGDRCLKETIKRIKPALRDVDFLARYGGEEFIVILPGTDLAAAGNVAERVRYLIEKTRFMYQGEEIPLTISIGVTVVRPSDKDEETLFTRADEAVYEAKRAGRNRVVCSDT